MGTLIMLGTGVVVALVIAFGSAFLLSGRFSRDEEAAPSSPPSGRGGAGSSGGGKVTRIYGAGPPRLSF